MSTSKPIIFITGANTGLGLEVVKALAKSPTPYEIIIGSRDPQKGHAAIEQVQKLAPQTTSTLSTIQIDISSDESILHAREEITSKHGKLDILINNAGANLDRQLQDGSRTIRETWNAAWDVNVAGTMVTTAEFVPLLLKSSDPRLLFITSGTASLTETEDLSSVMSQKINSSPEAGWPKKPEPNPLGCYRSTKVGLNMAMREWYRVLKNDGVKVWAISPGFLATNLSGFEEEELKKMGAQDPAIGGEFIKTVIEGKRDGDQGKAIRANMIQPW